MKNRSLISLILGLIAFTITACKQPDKAKASADITQINTDNITRNVYTDDEFGEDDMEVVINNTKNTVTINLNGETFQLKKSFDLPDYTAEDVEYRYSDIRGEITFLRKDFDMVLFHHELKRETKKTAKIASY